MRQKEIEAEESGLGQKCSKKISKKIPQKVPRRCSNPKKI